MEISAFLVQAINGLASASSLFLVAAGLSLIFGVTRVVNFAHGSFFMLGVYVAYSLVAHAMPWLSPYAPNTAVFFLLLFCTGLVTGAIGAAFEVTILRRIYQAPELFDGHNQYLSDLAHIVRQRAHQMHTTFQPLQHRAQQSVFLLQRHGLPWNP